MSRGAWLCCGLLAACGGEAAPWTQAPSLPLDLKLTVQPESAQLLQPIVVTLDLFAAKGVEPEFAPVVDSKDFLVTTQVQPDVPLFDGIWRRTVLECKPVRGPGELMLPSFRCTQKGGDAVASTPERSLTVTTALVGAAAGIEAPGDLLALPFRGGWWIAGGVAALLALVGGWWWWRAHARRRPLPEAVALPAHVKALRALQRLRGSPRTTPADIERFYVEVSDVLRTYVEERFGVHAPERTTEEFLRDLDTCDHLLRTQRAELERFLSQCDLVKFAAHVPTESDHLAAWTLAEAFVQATRVDRRTEAVA